MRTHTHARARVRAYAYALCGMRGREQGGGIFISQGSVNLRGCTIHSNKAPVRVDRLVAFSLPPSQTLIAPRASHCVQMGGGIHVERAAEHRRRQQTEPAEESEHTAAEETAHAHAQAAARVRTPVLKLDNTKVHSNHATTDKGGGVCLISGIALVTRSEVSGNTARKGGGGLFLGAYQVKLQSCVISDNWVADDSADGSASDIFGGGVHISKAAGSEPPKVTFERTQIFGNMMSARQGAFARGGGVAVSGGNVEVSRCGVYANIADLGGGLLIGTSASSISSQLCHASLSSRI